MPASRFSPSRTPGPPGTLSDRILERKIVPHTISFLSAQILDIGYSSPRFPLPLIQIVFFPALAIALAFAISRSPYWKRKRAFAPALATVRGIFTSVGAQTSNTRLGVLRITHLDSVLQPFEPIPAVIAIGPAEDSDVTALVENIQALHGKNRHGAGFLFYLEQPTALSLLRMAEARINGLAVIPIPLAAAERALASPQEARALLSYYAERYLPGRNLFDDRNAIGDAVAFFGRGRLLAALEEDLLNGQSIGLWGLRKAGKTSILLQLEQMFRRRTVVRIGLESYAADAPFGNRIFNDILRQVRAPRDFPLGGAARDSAAEFIAAAEAAAARLRGEGFAPPIVCMLDEMERILPNGAASAEEFNVTFGALRNLCQDKRIFSLIVTDLFPDSDQINVWPFEGGGTNPLFNFLKSVYVGPFDENDTAQMIDSLGKLMNFPLDEPERNAIHALAGGHPFLARQVAAMLYEKRDGAIARERLLANPIRYSETLRSYFPENVWRPLEARGDSAALAILSELAEASGWIPATHLEARCRRPKTVFWSAIEWLAQTGVIARQADDAGDESYRISIGMFVEWFRQSEVSAGKHV